MTSLPPDPYKVLGVSRDAQVPEIRSAHRKLVLKCHPDKIQDPTLKAQKQDEFQRVQQAYELLSDDLQRQKYDDKVKLEELRKQFQTKANISSPRSSPRYSGQDEVRGTEARPSSFKASATTSDAKFAYDWTSDEEPRRTARIFESFHRSSRREAGYTEKSSKRDVERERDYELERERDRERDRETRERREREKDRRRKQEDAIRRAEKDAKEARRAEKKAREKRRDKDIKRETDEKKRYAKPYIDGFEDELPTAKSERKKSSGTSSKKMHDELRDHSSGREDTPTAAHVPPLTPHRSFSSYLDSHAHTAYVKSYIDTSQQAKNGVPVMRRSAAHHMRPVQPPAPTPPPIPGQSASFTFPIDDDSHRPTTKSRRGSAEEPRLARGRTYHGSSREVLGDPPSVKVSGSVRHTAPFSSAAPGTPPMASSPPRTDLHRTKTMPVESPSYGRPPSGLARSQTFNAFESGNNARGRGRSRMHAQMDVDSDSDEAYDRSWNAPHRSGRQRPSPEPRTESISRYHIDGGRSRLQSSWTRRVDSGFGEPYAYFVPPHNIRPSMPVRESNYSVSAMPAKFSNVKTSKDYDYNDVHYSYHDKLYHDKLYREEPTARA